MPQEQVVTNSNQDTTLDFEEENTVEAKSSKVDINILMDRVRSERKKEKKENLIFLSLIASVILITGVIASF